MLWLLRRRSKPIPARPNIVNAKVLGSGTAVTWKLWLKEVSSEPAPTLMSLNTYTGEVTGKLGLVTVAEPLEFVIAANL